jgi:hypothetical protein
VIAFRIPTAHGHYRNGDQPSRGRGLRIWCEQQGNYVR